jgi:hypothetical protein
MLYRLAASFLICSAVLTQGVALARQGQQSGSAQIEEMKKLNFLVGEWKGEGWTEFVPGQRRTAIATEKGQTKLGGTILVLEGMGKAKVPGKQEEVVVHNAMGILSYDSNAKIYRVRSYLANGHWIDAEGKFTDKGFQWAFQVQGMSMRYTVKLNEKGEWFEFGEMSQDGKTWRQFHEMTLQRVN